MSGIVEDDRNYSALQPFHNFQDIIYDTKLAKESKKNILTRKP